MLKQGLVRLNIDAALVGNVDEGGQWFCIAQQVAQYVEFNAESVTFAGLMDYLAQYLAVGCWLLAVGCWLLAVG
ncbi:hypothetical protein, partial [Aeromonas sp. HMWF014]|uniref:hypothetical protein n=1 Tax=Aeromonas sp. HMWF014 TaxID=2056850 RepID=UPI002159F77E